jgi:hypothetical protein
VSRGPDHRLTGLEQYSLERAGYFIRRGALDNQTIEEGRDGVAGVEANFRASEGAARNEFMKRLSTLAERSPLSDIVEDMIPGAKLKKWGVRHGSLKGGRGRWGREIHVDWTLPESEQLAALHSHAPAVVIFVPFQSCSTLCVVPGSHAQAVSPETATRLKSRLNCDLDESVCLKLDAGDVVVASPVLLLRHNFELGTHGVSVRYLFDRLPASAPHIPSET